MPDKPNEVMGQSMKPLDNDRAAWLRNVFAALAPIENLRAENGGGQYRIWAAARMAAHQQAMQEICEIFGFTMPVR